MGFDKTMIAVRTADGLRVVTLEPFTFTRPSGDVITVPAGTQSDGASIPEALWSTGLAPFGTYWLATVLHDYLYRDTARLKEECDTILLEAMQALYVDETQATLIYEGVHFGGWKAFRGDRTR